MKYRIKKELPYYKVGEEIHIHVGNYHLLFHRYNHSLQISSEGLEMLFADGWIEEIKPRE